MIKLRSCPACGGPFILPDKSVFWHCSRCGQYDYERPGRLAEAVINQEVYKTPAKASERQVGGEHYKTFAIQPSFYCHVNNLGHMASSIVKYATRAGLKDGAAGLRKDIEKIAHYAELWLEYLNETPEISDEH
jgi:ribosomal protein S27AE